MSGCPRSSLILECVRYDTGQHFHHPARCKQWSCPHCGPINSKNLGRLLAEVMDSYMAEHRLTGAKMRYTLKSVTLTPPGAFWRSIHGVDDAVKLLKKALKRLLALLKRHWCLEEYFWVMEFGQDGFPHIHLLILGTGISGKGIMRFINDSWECLGMGRSEVKLVKSSGGVCHYFTKYLCKAKQKGSADGSHVWGMSSKLRQRVKERKELASENYEVLRIFRKNEDGSCGSMLWEKGAGVTLLDALEKANLKELSEYFYSKQNQKGEQTYFWNDD